MFFAESKNSRLTSSCFADQKIIIFNTMDMFRLTSFLVCICAVFAYINTRFIKLPSSIGLMLIALVFSILIIIEGHVSSIFHAYVEKIIRNIDFPHIVLDIMLGFLLFAGSLHVNFEHMMQRGAAITSFALLGTALSTFLYAFLIYPLFNLFGLHVDFIYCLLFGALISPTDPIAVLGILKKANLPKDISIMIEGESLFNDGIGVVFFVTILELINSGVENLSFTATAFLFCREVLGGILLGLALGFIVYFLIKKINDYHTIVLISLALVMLNGQLAHLLHVSGPLAVIVIGLMFGTKIHSVLDEKTRDYNDKFWELTDDFLNALLFVLIGLQMMLLPFLLQYIGLGLLAILILLICRFISIRIPMIFMRNKTLFNTRSSLVMTWGGLRGGLSVALTLSLPENPFKVIIVSVTFIIVIFSVLVQGLTTEKLVKRLFREQNQQA
jgi:CPA1 family monovalent cation:H+ antiporter